MRRVSKRLADTVIGELVEAGLAPAPILDLAVAVDVVGATTMAVVADPALICILATSPLDQRTLAHPGVIVVLVDAAELGVFGSVKDLGVALGKHDEIGIE